MKMKAMASLLPLYLAMSGMDYPAKDDSGKRMRDEASLYAMVKEYNLIKKKQSKLSRAKRDYITQRIDLLIEQGKLVRTESGEASFLIFTAENKEQSK